MALYTIGSGGDYATIDAAEAALSLPEAGGTIYEITGTVTEPANLSLSNSSYANGVIIRAKAGEEADGAGGGAFLDAHVQVSTSGANRQLDNLRVRNTQCDYATGAPLVANNCDIGYNATVDIITILGDNYADLTNCIIRGDETTSDDAVYRPTNNTNATFDRCTIVGASRYGAMRGVFTDCLILSSGTADFLDAATGSDYNASSDSSAPGTNVFTGRTTADLEDYAGGDYNLASGSSLQTSGSSGGAIGASLAAVPTDFTLSSPTATVTGPQTATVTVDTDTAQGDVYYYISQNATETDASIVANAPKLPASATGTQTYFIADLSPSTSYYAHFYQKDGALVSNVISTAQFTTDATTRTIVDIDSDNDVNAGQTNITITTTDLDAAPTVQTATLGGETITVNTWSSTSVNVDIPANIGLKYAELYTLVLTDDTGSVSKANVTLSPPVGWTQVTYDGTVLDEATTESIAEHAKTDATIGNYTMAASDILVWEGRPSLSFTVTTAPDGAPDQTYVDVPYKIWKDAEGAYTPTSTFTITDLGVFGAASPISATLYRNPNRGGALLGENPNGDASSQGRLRNFNQMLSDSFQGGFTIGLHEVTPHPDYPSVTAYSSNQYDPYTGGASGIALNPNGTSFYVVGFGGAYNTSDQNSNNGGGIDSVAELTIPSLVKNVDTSDITGFNETTVSQTWKGVFDPAYSLTSDKSATAVTGIHVDGSRLVCQTMVEYDSPTYTESNAIIFENRSDLVNSAVKGYYSFVPNGETGQAAHAATWVSDIPSHLQTELGATKIFGGGGNFSILDRLPCGPTMFTGNIPSTLPDPAVDQTIDITRLMDFWDQPDKQMGAHLFTPVDSSWYAVEMFNANPNRSPLYLCNQATTDYEQVDPWINNWWTILAYGAYGFIVPNTRTYCVIGALSGAKGGSSYKPWPPYRGSRASGPARIVESDKNNYYWLFSLDDILSATNPWELMPYEYGPLDFFDALQDKDGDRATILNVDFDKASGKLAVVVNKMVGSTQPQSCVFMFQNNDWMDA